MHKPKKIGYFLLLIAVSCNKLNNSTNVGDVIHGLSTDSTQIVADGAGLVHATVLLDSLATSDRWGVLFKINTGNFAAGSANPADTTEVVQAQFIGISLSATAAIQVPQRPGLLIISAQPSVPQAKYNNDYVLQDTVKLMPSIPATVVVTTTSVGLASNFGSQITVTGSIYNSAGSKVSLGNKVAFGDSVAGPLWAGGTWTSPVDTVNTASQVSAIYSIGVATVGTPVTLTCTVLDSTGAKTPVRGTAVIYINK